MTSSKGSFGCFGQHPSAIIVFTSAQTTQTKELNEPEFNLNRLNAAGVKTLKTQKKIYIKDHLTQISSLQVTGQLLKPLGHPEFSTFCFLAAPP